MSKPDLPADLAKSRRFAPEVVRRDFLGLGALWTFLVTGILMMLGMLRLPMPSLFPERGSKFRLGPPDRFPKGSTTILHDRNVLVRHDERGICAISLVCTHLGCIVRREADESFACPCHGSRFDAQGKVVKGPAPTALRFLEVTRAETGELLCDRATIVDRNVRFHPGESS